MPINLKTQTLIPVYKKTRKELNLIKSKYDYPSYDALITKMIKDFGD